VKLKYILAWSFASYSEDQAQGHLHFYKMSSSLMLYSLQGIFAFGKEERLCFCVVNCNELYKKPICHLPLASAELSRYGDGLQAARPGFDSWQGREIFLFNAAFISAVLPPVGSRSSLPEGVTVRA
jgi:hypothetical protein